MHDTITQAETKAHSKKVTTDIFPKKLTIVAHRGGKGSYPENSLEAFLHTTKNGCKALEMDLRFDARKKQFFLEHDFIHLPKKRKNTVDKVIPFLPKGTTLFVEIKSLSWVSKKVTRAFTTLFHDYFDIEHTVIISFNPFVLAQLRKMIPGIRLGFLCGNPFWNTLFKKILYTHIRPELYLLHRRLLSAKNVLFGKEKKMKVFSFVLNKEHYWQKALKLNVDGIITDYPEKISKLL